MASLLFTAVARAGVNEWTSLGPWVSGGAKSLAVDPTSPNIIYAGAGPNVFRSADGGATWSDVGSGIAVYDVAALAVNPKTPSTILAGTDQGIFRSLDAGKSWSAAYLAGYSSVTSIAIDPVAPEKAYASIAYTGPSVSGIQGGALLKSVDGGATWQSLSAGPYYVAVRVVALNPDAPSTIYAATSSGLFRSDDGATTWKGLSVPVTFNAWIGALTIDAASPSTIYAGTTESLFRSSDRGETWTDIGSGLPSPILKLTALPGAPSTIYAATASGLFKSTNGGASWLLAGSGINGAVAALVSSGGLMPILYTATDQGVFKLVTPLETWIGISSPFAAPQVNALTLSPGALFAGTNSGLFKTLNGGASWTDVSSGLGSKTVQALATVVPNGCSLPCVSGLVVYAGTDRGLFRSTDGGASWEAVRNYALASNVRSIAQDPSNSNVIYVGSGDRVAKSSDAGATWAPAGPGHLRFPFLLAVLLDPTATSVVYAVTSSDIFKSSDAGVTWTALKVGFAPTSLAIAEGSLYAGTQVGIFTSRDGGATWSAINSGLTSYSGGPPWISTFAVDPQSPVTVYVGCAIDGIFQTQTGGSAWLLLDEGLPYAAGSIYPAVYSLLVDPADSSTVYAGTAFGTYAITLRRQSIEPIRRSPRTVVRPFVRLP